MSELPHTFRYTIGDWSDDGHGKTEVLQIESSHSMKEIAEAYEKVCDEHDFDFIGQVASQYEDRHMPAERFLEWGMDREAVCFENDPDDDPSDWTVGYTDHYVALLHEFCKLALPDLVMKAKARTRDDDLCFAFKRRSTSHHGYGLF